MAQAPFLAQAAYPTTVAKMITTALNSDQQQIMLTQNNLLNCLQRVLAALGGTAVPLTTSTLSRGTTVTLACSASNISVSGVFASVAAETAKAFGSLGTIPTGKWGLIAVERVAAGTTSFVSAADNYTTGYATEALAIAAKPAATADKAVIGYITILAASPGWVAGTDALAGGTGGTPATTTNYYSTPGAVDMASWTSVKQITTGGSVVTA